MKKLLSIAIAAIGLLICTVSCNKTPVLVERYGFDQDQIKELQYVIGHEEDAMNFINELNAVTERFDGTEFTEEELVAAYDAVVDRYNNSYIAGTFSLFKFNTETGAKIATVKTWTMRVAD